MGSVQGLIFAGKIFSLQVNMKWWISMTLSSIYTLNNALGNEMAMVFSWVKHHLSGVSNYQESSGCSFCCQEIALIGHKEY